ncbi:MAG: ComF family protein [Bacteroidia bacterium]
MLASLLNLVYPELCITCRRNLLKFENFICLHCEAKLPYSNYHLTNDNPVEKTFWGRFPFEYAFAFLLFNKKGMAQKLLHQLKYNNNKELAMHLGKLYGLQLKSSNKNFDFNGVIAVPLHISKLRQRGYNQSEWFAKGISESLQIEDFSYIIKRTIATSTQTKKSRIERWQNVADIFELNKPETIYKKHILLVDDVITTGATIEACANTILKANNTKISIASIAFAQ